MEGMSLNQTVIFNTEFVLFGFPGIIKYRKLLLIPFLFLYIIIMAGNLFLIHRIFTEPKLHSPMYILMSILFAANVTCTISILPKFLLGLSFDMNQISLLGCLIQMFFIYLTGAFESAIILMMGLDRFLAICRPLRYNDIMTKRFIVQLVLIGLARSFLIVLPTIIITSTVHFCRSNIILNFVCENMGLLSLACGPISKLHLVGLVIKSSLIIADTTFLLVSYSSILYTAMKITAGKSRHKGLQTCVSHMAVATLIYLCSFLTAIIYRIRTHISYDVKNLVNAIYLLVPAAFNPFFYGVGVKKIRRCIFKSWKKRNPVHLH